MNAQSNIINFLSGAKIRVGVNSVDGIKNKSSFLLNVKSDFHWNANKTHQIDRGLDIVKQLGITTDNSIYDSLKITIPADEIKSAKKIFRRILSG